MPEIGNGPPKGAVRPVVKPPVGYDDEGSARPTPHQLKRAPRRTIVYVDGFNLYYGMHEKHGRKYLWLDLQTLAERLLKPDQSLVRVKYFTARMRNSPDSAARQAEYLGALRGRGVEVVEGRFQEKTQHCNGCGDEWRSYEEKESDVNFCVGLLDDAHAHAFDHALLITADSDMTPAVRAVKRRRHDARLVAVFPPKRRSTELQRAVDASLQLGTTLLRQCQLPETVMADGRAYSRPKYWT